VSLNAVIQLDSQRPLGTNRWSFNCQFTNHLLESSYSSSCSGCWSSFLQEPLLGSSDPTSCYGCCSSFLKKSLPPL